MLKGLVATEAERGVTVTLRDRISEKEELIIDKKSRIWKLGNLPSKIFFLLRTLRKLVD